MPHSEWGTKEVTQFMLYRAICLLCWMLLSCVHAQASSPAIQAQYAYIHSDESLSLASAMRVPNGQWQDVPSFGNHGFESGEFWLRVRLENSLNIEQSAIFRFVYPSHDEVDFYELSQAGDLIHAWQQGDMRDQSNSPVMDKHPAVKLNFAAKESKWLYVRVASLNALVLTTDILSEKEHQKSVHVQGILSSLIYGVLLVMALYNLGLAISMKDKTYYCYVLYVVAFIGFILTLSGDGYYYFWPESPNLNRVLLPVLSGFLIIPSLLFPYYLLDIKKHAPQVSWFYQGTFGVAVIFLLTIPIIGIGRSIVILNTLSATLSVAMLIMGLYLSYKRVPLARLYTFAWCILLLGLAVLSLSSLGIVENNLVTRSAGLLGGVAEAIILSLALAQRIAQERKDKMQAIQEAMHSRKLFQELFDQAPIGIARVELSGKIITLNPVLTKMLGYDTQEEALQYASLQENLLENHSPIKQELLVNNKVMDRELSLRTAQGKLIPCSMSLHLQTDNESQYVEAFVTDISVRKDAQLIKELMEQERLVSMEQLVTGVAHEINTPLGVNITSISHVNEMLDEVDREMQSRSLTRDKFQRFIEDSQQLFKIVNHNLQKMSNLVRRFKLVSIGNSDKVNMNLRQHIELSLHSHLLIGEDIEIALNCAHDISIESYPAAWDIILEQLLENSIVHGFKPDQVHKKIRIDITSLGEDNWRFEYEDNGQGVNPQVLERVFDPFVTTKRGSSDHAGLGMYRIYNLIHRVFDGDIKLLEAPGFHLVINFKAQRLGYQQIA